MTPIVKRMYLLEILDYIPQTDLRSAESWCNRNQVKIYKDGRNKFVVKVEFINAYNRPVFAAKSTKTPLESDSRYIPQSQAARGLQNNYI